MSVKTSVYKKPRKLKPIHGVVCLLICSIVAEIFFASMSSPPHYIVRLGRLALAFLVIYTIHRYAIYSLHSYKPSIRELATISLVIVCSLFLVWISRFIAVGMLASAENIKFIPPISEDSVHFIVPYAAGALIIQAILGLHYGLIFALIFSFLVGMYSPQEILLTPYILCSTLVACLSLVRFRSRSAYLKAGFNVILIALPFALASVVLFGNIDTAAADLAFRLMGIVIAGIFSAAIAILVTPLFEYLGGYVTDMRLIEMATLDHPLLKELSIQAPGTWNHSMVMGMMVESAADSIGANPVLARVSAYFHDIGKMKKPLYFVENQTPGENRHDKLSTSMSALIIRSHVKDGIDLAKKHKLPQVIEDMIPQHHGTSLIEFFYDKACKDIEEAGGDPAEVDKSLYSYPGPKPQTKEAGILMLADGIEAATRTLSEPSLDRIQGLVQKMINKVFSSGELNECELTLTDLHKIAKCFTRVLNGIYHQRVAYAEPAEKVNEKPQLKNGEEENDEPAKELASSDTNKKPKDKSERDEDRKDSKEDLKRLGL